MFSKDTLIEGLKLKLGEQVILSSESAADGNLVIYAERKDIIDVLSYLKYDSPCRFRMLYDITAVDERMRTEKSYYQGVDFVVVYQLISFETIFDVRIKVPLKLNDLSLPSITSLWPNANWYERETYDMFGIIFTGHPNLRRILLPKSWKGFPLRKEYPARATEHEPYFLDEQMRAIEDADLKFDPSEWGLVSQTDETDFMFLNIGPQHPGTHGLLRLVVQLVGEDIAELVPDIGFHHRGAEKMGERQTWHSYIPYTDRIDYLGGVINNLAYVQSVEKIAGIDVPDRAKVIRIMMSELFRIASHLVWLGTYAQDLGQMSPVFYAFNDREKIFDIVTAVTGGRMHPSWFRIGGVAHDLPIGWNKLVKDFVDYFPKSIREFKKAILQNRIFRERTVGIGVYTTNEAIEWGVTGPGLRSTGCNWDFRKNRPYGGFENFDFEIPVGKNGDCYDRAVVHIEEMYQSLRIVNQCMDNMPEGDYKSLNKITSPPIKERTTKDIETLINHFVNVTWGPVVPVGEAMVPIEAAKGSNGYFLVSDGGTSPYRSRIRTPSFPHIQMLPYISKGYTVADLLSILGALDFVLADLDR